MGKYIRTEDWMNAAKNKEFAEYMKRARKRLDEGEIATAREIKKIYRRVAKQIADEIAGAIQGTLRYSHLEYLHKVLNEAARQINDDLLKAINKGIYIAVEASTEAAQQTFIDLAKEIWATPVIKQAFATIHERAVMALLARTGPDGLKLSDRVWRISQRARNALKVIVEDGVVRGLDARKMARRVQQYLQPGVWTALKEETRKRLDVPKDVSMEAMRLAVTEMHNAFHEGTRMAWSAVPGIQGYYWRLSNWHPITDICDDYASYNGDGFWPKDQVPIKPHPWCRCYIIPAVEEADRFVERLREWVHKPELHPDIEEWYNEVKTLIPRPSIVAPPAVQIKYSNKAEAQRYLVEQLGFEIVNFGTISDEIAVMVVKNIEAVYEQYPFLRGYVHIIEPINDPTSYAMATTRFDYANNQIKNVLKISELFMGDIRELKEYYESDVASNYHPKGTDVNAIIIHEMGHFIETKLAEQMAKDARELWKMRFEERIVSHKLKEKVLKDLNVTDSPEHVTELLCKYANKNTSEFMAEAFAEAVNSPQPRKLAETFLKYLKEELKERGLIK
jgi:hypothetical protein